jgi:long-chain acyl-CoA synthetase
MEPLSEVSGIVKGFWKTASEHPDRIAVIDIDGSSITSGMLLDRVNRLSNAMVADGVTRGSEVAILTRNSADTLALILAASQVGAYHTMVNSHLAPPEVAYILEDSAPLLLFVDRHTAPLAEKASALSDLDRVVIRSIDRGVGFASLDEWIDGQSADAPTERAFGPAMLYTSGTSGNPKAVRQPLPDTSPDDVVVLRASALARYGIDPAEHVGDGCHLVTSPLYHAAPMYNALIALDLGHRVVIMDRFDAEAAVRLIDEHRVTWTHVVPTQMRRMIDLPPEVRGRYDTSSLKWFIHAAAPCPVDLKRRVIEWLGPVVWEYYSSTEGGGTVIGAADWLAHPGSVGRPWTGAHIRVVDDDGNDLPAGEVGDIYMLNTRPFVYHRDPEKTARARRGDYITAGDVGWLDEDGYLYLADRRTDLILTGGVNVYPAEVENVLASHPAVLDVGVIGRPDTDLGQTVHAVVIPRHADVDPDVLASELSAYLEQRLSPQKHPRSYDVRTELPRNEAGKLLRRVLRDELAAQ